MKQKNKAQIAQAIIDKIITIPVVILCLALIVISAAAIFNEQHVIHSADDIYQIKAQTTEKDRQFPSLTELQEINPEIIAWLTLDNTPIDYPITQAKDNSKYLNTSYDNKYAVHGNPFLDSRNNLTNDDFLIIYGHRMNQEKMFGSLIEYEKQDYLNKHTSGTITTSEGNFKLEVIAYAKIKLVDTRLYDLVDNRTGKNASIVSDIMKDSITTNRATKQGTDKLIMLSTCNKDAAHYRNVLLLSVGDKIE